MNSTARISRGIAAVGVTALVVGACVAPPPVGFPDGGGDLVTVEAPDTSGPMSLRGRDLIDAEGRVVQIHGINMVRKSAPFHVSPDEPSFDEQLTSVRRSGFNGVRLGVWMAELMPEPGVIDLAYLAEVERGIDALEAQDLWVLVDFHQDVFTGMPEWATTDAARALPDSFGTETFWALRYLAPRSLRQWEDFHRQVPVADGRSAADFLGDAIATVAQRVAGRTNVIGIDLMNEPFPGERLFDCIRGGCSGRYAELVAIFESYTAKVRAVAPDLPVWWEPYTLGPPFQEMEPPTQSNVGYTFHAYCLDTDGGAPVQPDPVANTLCRAVYDTAVTEAMEISRHWDAPALLSEFGASASPLNTTRLTELADEHLLSWMYWDDNYYRAASDIVRSDLVRTYAQATAGIPLSQEFDPATGAFDFRFRPDRTLDADTTIVVPTEVYPSGYVATATGGAITSSGASGLVTVAPDETSSVVSVRIRRTS